MCVFTLRQVEIQHTKFVKCLTFQFVDSCGGRWNHCKLSQLTWILNLCHFRARSAREINTLCPLLLVRHVFASVGYQRAPWLQCTVAGSNVNLLLTSPVRHLFFRLNSWGGIPECFREFTSSHESQLHCLGLLNLVLWRGVSALKCSELF